MHAMRHVVTLSNTEFVSKLVEADALGMYQRNQVLISAGETDHSLCYDFRSSGRETQG